MRVSTHLLVRRSGELVQYVPFGMRGLACGGFAVPGAQRLQ